MMKIRQLNELAAKMRKAAPQTAAGVSARNGFLLWFDRLNHIGRMLHADSLLKVGQQKATTYALAESSPAGEFGYADFGGRKRKRKGVKSRGQSPRKGKRSRKGRTPSTPSGVRQAQGTSTPSNTSQNRQSIPESRSEETTPFTPSGVRQAPGASQDLTPLGVRQEQPPEEQLPEEQPLEEQPLEEQPEDEAAADFAADIVCDKAAGWG